MASTSGGNKGKKDGGTTRNSIGLTFCGMSFKANSANREWDLQENWVEINVGDDKSNGSVVYLNIETNEVSDTLPPKSKPAGFVSGTVKSCTSSAPQNYPRTQSFIVKSLGNLHIDEKSVKAAKLDSVFAAKLVNDVFTNKSLMNEIPRLSDHSLVMEITDMTIVIVDPSNGEIHTAIPISELINFSAHKSKKNKFGLIASMTTADIDNKASNYFILLFASQKPWTEISKSLINGKMQQTFPGELNNSAGSSVKTMRTPNGVALRQKNMVANGPSALATRKQNRLSSSSALIKTIILDRHANNVNELFVFMGKSEFKADARQVGELLSEMKKVGKELLEKPFNASQCKLIMKKEDRQFKFVDLDHEKNVVVSLEIPKFKTAYINGEKNGLTIGYKLSMNIFEIYAFKSSENVERAYEIIKRTIQMG